MRTTVRLNDDLLKEVRRYAAERNTTMTRIIEEALREKLARKSGATRQRFTLRTFNGGGLQPGVNLDDNAGTRDSMDGLA